MQNQSISSCRNQKLNVQVCIQIQRYQGHYQKRDHTTIAYGNLHVLNLDTSFNDLQFASAFHMLNCKAQMKKIPHFLTLVMVKP